MRQTFATAIVEPNGLIREGLARILRASRFRIVGSAPELDETVLKSLREHDEVLLLIGCAGDHRATIRQIEQFKTEKPKGRVAIVCDRESPDEVLAAFKAGANAFFARGTSSDAFIKSLELVLLGETLMPAALLALFPSNEPVVHAPVRPVEPRATNDEAPQFSEQERRILRNLVEGDSNKAIARKVNIAEATVKVHVKSILRKLRLRNRTQAAVWAMNRGTLDSDAASALGNLVERISAPSPFAEMPRLNASLIPSE